MRIGILTYHDIPNFGAQLQAASTARFLSSQSYDVELVDYRPLRQYVRTWMRVVYPLRRRKFDEAKHAFLDVGAFRRSAKDMSRFSPQTSYLAEGAAKIAQRYDVLICGSDELWNFDNFLGYLPPFILDFEVRSGVRKLSYAASIGSAMLPAETRERMRRSLSSFEMILVRDPSTLAVVESLDLKARRVLDPTFIADLGPIEPSRRDYAVITGGMTSAQVDVAVTTARKLGLEPVSVGYFYASHPRIGVRATPREWIGYIRGAKAHITSLFHGAALSMKYDVPFSVFLTPGKEQKIESLVELFGQGGRLVPKDATVEQTAAAATLPYEAGYGVVRDGLVEDSQAALLAAVRG